jgi:hypothetical protein
MVGMTRARNRTHGLGNPPLIQLLLEAVLCVFVSLVQGVRTTLGMIFNRTHRDWHTESAHEDLPQATSGISSQGTNAAHAATPGKEADKVRLTREGRGPVLREAQTPATRMTRAFMRATTDSLRQSGRFAP